MIQRGVVESRFPNMLRVAYIDVGVSSEEYGLFPTKYGGGAVVSRYLKEDNEIDFHIFAPKESFDNLTGKDRIDRCFILPQDVCEALKRGYPIDKIKGLDINSFDLVLHGHTCASLYRGNYRGPICHWSGFDGAAGNSNNDYILLYDPSFRAQFGEKVKYVKIGKPVPATFIPSIKDNYIFTCSRHDDHMASINIAKACLSSGIKGVFVGPIHHNYPLMDYIDGKTTIYIGEIGEENKLDFCRHATLFALLLEWEAPFSQSLIEAQGQGTPIYVNKRGPFLESYLKHTINGFDASLFTLEQAFHSARTVDMQRECWEAASQYSVPVMVSSFKKAFYEIAEEWKGKSTTIV